MSDETGAIELVVEKAVYRGQGLARLDGRVVLLPRALPGERVRARVTARERGFLRAEVLEVLAPSPDRRDSPCPHFPECGGCAWQELAYSAQRRLKQAVLHESLARGGVPWDGELEVRASSEEAWRSRATLHAAMTGGRLRMGLHRALSHDVVEVDRCRQLSEPLRRGVAALTAVLEAHALGPEIVDLRVAEAGDVSRRAVLLTLRSAAPGIRERLRAAVAQVEAIDGVAVAVARGRGRHTTIRGEPRVQAEVLGAPLTAHVASFFQANRFLLEPLVEAVLEPIPVAAEVLDLFAGVGLFAIAAARRRDARAVAVESSSTSARDARDNASQLAGGAVRVRRADARVGLAGWKPRRGPAVVVVDPPRSGLDRDLLAALSERRQARIVYVSCDAPSLGRDLARFASRGWRAARLQAFDLFPDTFHLETVVTLESPLPRV